LFSRFAYRRGLFSFITNRTLWGGKGTGVRVAVFVGVGEFDGVGVIDGVGVLVGVSVGSYIFVSVDCILSAVEANDVEVDSISTENTVALI
jgi:hypothetical protein